MTTSSSAGTRSRFLDGAIVPQLVQLALPILVVLALQTLVGVAETYFVARLGTDAAVGVSVVFPLLMLMTMVSNGGIGGGVASAVARALGAGRRADAEAILLHAVLVAIGFGIIFSSVALYGGRALYRALGADGGSLVNALSYSNLVFGASILIWVTNLLSAALRGAGNVRIPAILITISSVGTLLLSPLFIFGLGPVQPMRVAGAGFAMIINYVISTVALIAYLRSPSAPIRLIKTPIRWRLFKEILGVGGLSALGAVQANLTVLLITGLVGHWGATALAGYGMASRLDFILIPLLFALGTASVTMVGTNVGASQPQRAMRIALVAALISAGIVEVIGVVAAVFPTYWMRIFSTDPEVVRLGASYLTRVGPFYAIYGIGMALYFASQGAGKVLWPLFLGSGRLFLTVIGGWFLVRTADSSVLSVFWLTAAGFVWFGVSIAGAFLGGLVVPRHQSRTATDGSSAKVERPAEA